MSDYKFEDQIKKIADGASLEPDVEVWDRLVIRKDVSSKSIRPKLNWVKVSSYAACMLLLVSFYHLFTTDSNINVDKYANHNYVTAELVNETSGDFDFKNVHSLNKAYGSFELKPKSDQRFKLKAKLQ